MRRQEDIQSRPKAHFQHPPWQALRKAFRHVASFQKDMRLDQRAVLRRVRLVVDRTVACVEPLGGGLGRVGGLFRTPRRRESVAMLLTQA